MGKRLDVTSADVFVSWLPLYHDMGLIGAWLGTLYFGCQLVLMSPARFLMDPSRWLRTISEVRGTLSASPNFGYELCLKRVQDEQIEGIDLSSWRHALNGAEPVNAETVRNFSKRFATYGLPANALMPVYGLAESTVGLTMPLVDESYRIDRIDRDRFQSSGEVKLVEPGAINPLEYVACGRPIEGQEVRVVDITGHELPSCREGLIEFRGVSSTDGYYRNSESNATLFRDGWLATGDRGYFRDDNLYVTGRVKDMIIRGGRNIHPTELDGVIGSIPQIRKGCVASFGDTDAAGRELLVVVAETAVTDATHLEALTDAIRQRTVEVLNLPPDRVLLVPPHSVLKTSSGKIRRADTRELFRRGLLTVEKTPLWRTRLELAKWSSAAWAAQTKTKLKVFLYSGWAWSWLVTIGAVVWLSVAIAPTLAFRWAIARWGCRTYTRLAGVHVDTLGIEHLPADSNWAIASNHNSYLDGLFLVLTIPRDMRFVAKKELASQFVAGTFLRRLNSIFVERDDPAQGSALAELLGDALHRGDCLAVFPEGTFFRTPGLLPFHMGVFSAAAKSRRVVVPVVLRGVGNLLRSGSWLLSRGRVSVTVGTPIEPGGGAWDDAVELRRAVDEAIHDRLG